MIPTKTIDKYGDEYWQLPNGAYHREDGPAIIWNDGELFCIWFLMDDEYDFDAYCSELKRNYGKTDEDIMMIKMQYDIN